MDNFEYYNLERRDIQHFLPERLGDVLDVGCAAGRLGKALKEKGAASVTGIELVPEVAGRAALVLDKVICGDVETIELPFPPESFDTIICADVIEHLRDPWAAVKRLVSLLKPGSGRFIACIPNICYYKIMLLQFLGSWPYSNEGILDRTHLRFFSPYSAHELLTAAGLSVIEVQPLIYERDVELAARIGREPLHAAVTNMFKMLESEMSPESLESVDVSLYFAYQFVFICER
jgi:O-antigen biosynthesis protein